jgi:hypothetical protein
MKKLIRFLSAMFVSGMLATVLHGQIIVGNYTATSFQSGQVLPSSCSGSAIFTLTTTWIPYFCNGGTYTAFGVGGSGISGVTAGTGLTGGGTSGNVTISLSTPVSIANGGTGNTTGQAASATSVAGGSAGAQPYQTAASTTAFVYPATDANTLNLDGNRTDSYTPDGTPERPYKTLTQLVSGMAGVTGAYLIACNPTTAAYTYTGVVTFPNYQGTIIGNGCSWNITGNVSVPGVYFISNLYTTITGTLSYTGSTTAEKVRLGGSLIVSGGITTSGYDHFFDMSILSNTVINVGAGSTPVFTNVVGTPLFKSASGSTASTVLTIIDSQSLASGAYTNVDMSNGGLAVIRGFIATNNNTVPNINLAGSSGSSASVASSLASVSVTWAAAGSSYVYIDNGSIYGLLTGSNLLTPNGLGMSAPGTNTMTVKSGTTGTATFDSGTTGAVKVGTGANAKTVTIGNTTGATSLVLNAGTAGVSGSVVSTDGAMTANSDTLIPSQKAVVTYVGNKINGLAWRPAVQHADSATTAPGTAIVGQTSYTSDGFALVNGDRILFMNASSGTYLNKVYTVAGVGTSITLTLATDGQSGTGAPTNGDALYATQGTVNGGKIFVYSSTSATWVQASSPAGTLLAANNLSDVSNAATTRANISAAKSGANSDITSLTGLTTPLSTAQGGTGAGVLTGYRYANGSGADTASTTIPYSALTGTASSGANSNITSLTGLTTALPVSEGGTGAATAAANSVFGNATGSTAAPGFTQNPSIVTLQASSAITTPLFNASTCTGTAQAEVLTLSPALLSQAVNTAVQCTPVAANTGAGATLNVNGLGARTITKCGGQAIAANDLITGTAAYFTSTGTTWELLNPIAGACGTSMSGVTSQYLSATRTASQTTNLTTGSAVLFTTIPVSSGTDITLNTTTGVFTLAAGHTYELIASVPQVANSNTGAQIAFQWYNFTTSAYIGSPETMESPTSPAYDTSGGLAVVVLSPTVTTNVQLNIAYTSSTISGIGTSADFGTVAPYPYARIYEIPATTSLPAGTATINTIGGLMSATDVSTVANTILLTTNPTVTSLTANDILNFTPAYTNSGAVTVNVDSIGAYPLYKCGSTPLTAGDIVAGVPAQIQWSGTTFQLYNPQAVNCGMPATSGVTSQYLRAYQSTNEGNPATGGYIYFNTLQISSGTDISINLTTGVVTLAAGHTYSIVATPGYVNFGSTSGSSSYYDLYNITSATAIPSSGCYYTNSSAATNITPVDSPCSAIIQTTVTTSLAFQLVGAVNPGTLIPSNGSAPWISIQEIPATTALPAGSATGNTLAGLRLGTDTGTAQAHVVTLSPAITSNQAGTEVYFNPAAANTATAPTLAVSGLAAMTITVCGTNAAVAGDIAPGTIADVISDGTYWQLQNPKVSVCGSVISGGIIGVSNGVAASSGYVGQVVKGCLASGSGTALTSASTINLITLNNLSAGDWDVEGNVNLVANALTATNGNFAASITTTSATLSTDGSEVRGTTIGMSGTTGYNGISLPRVVVNISTPTNVYLVTNFQGTISSGSGTLWGCMTARRVR